MATNSAHTEVPGGGHKFPPLQSETYASQVLWLAVTFGLLYLLMSRLALPRVASILEQRQKRIENDFAEAQRLKQESDAAIATYEKALTDARSRAQALAHETRQKQVAAADALRKSVEKDLNGRMAEAEDVIAAAKIRAMANVQSIAAETAAAIVQRLIGTVPAGQEIAEAVAAVLKR